MPLNVDAAILRPEPRDGLSVTWMASSCHVKPNAERRASSASDSAARSKSFIFSSVDHQVPPLTCVTAFLEKRALQWPLSKVKDYPPML
jgi:hypothetical protein